MALYRTQGLIDTYYNQGLDKASKNSRGKMGYCRLADIATKIKQQKGNSNVLTPDLTLFYSAQIIRRLFSLKISVQLLLTLQLLETRYLEFFLPIVATRWREKDPVSRSHDPCASAHPLENRETNCASQVPVHGVGGARPGAMQNRILKTKCEFLSTEFHHLLHLECGSKYSHLLPFL